MAFALVRNLYGRWVLYAIIYVLLVNTFVVSERVLNYIKDDLKNFRLSTGNRLDSGSDEENQSFETVLSHANIILQIDNIVLFSDLTDAHRTVVIGSAFDDTLTEEQRQQFIKQPTKDEELFWLRQLHRYEYDRSNRLPTDIEDVTISSIERL